MGDEVQSLSLLKDTPHFSQQDHRQTKNAKAFIYLFIVVLQRQYPVNIHIFAKSLKAILPETFFQIGQVTLLHPGQNSSFEMLTYPHLRT